LARCHPWAAGGVDHVPAKNLTAADSPAADPASQTPAPPAHAA
jgi:putative component of membrane protein insertase Oxa1/YidC/SpoIIIJ protein YidD